MTNIIKEKDLELFNDNINKIQDEIKKKTWNLLEPTGDTKMEIINKVLEYIKTNKRKVYGSYAHNKVIIHKNKKDGFLSNLEVPDIDFYSPEPLNDLYKLCNMFHNMGYNNIVGQEAQHEETYKIFVNDIEACDISYVPKNIYNKIPFIEIDNIHYIHPNWAMIDYLRILTDPLTSWEIKLDKRFKRFYLLQKNYPIPKLEKQLNINFKDDRSLYLTAVNKIYRYLVDKSSILISGLYAYNYYLHYSDMKKYDLTDITYYELISTNYNRDTTSIIELLKESYNDEITYEEYYPFFQFTNFTTKIYYKNNLICTIYDNNNKCYPYHKVEAIYFEKNKFEENKGNINIVSFNLLLLFTLINYMYYRTNDDVKQKDLQMLIISHLIQFRNYYLDKNKKTIFDKTLFADFVINCIGETVTSKKLQSERVKLNLANNKPAVFKYRPEQGLKNEAPVYQFKNSSGNKINNEKNLKINI
jgi:hypothetical protein